MSVLYTILYCRICKKFQAVPFSEIKCPECGSVDPNQMMLSTIKKDEKTIIDTCARMVFGVIMENAEEKNKDLVLKQKNDNWKTRIKSLFNR